MQNLCVIPQLIMDQDFQTLIKHGLRFSERKTITKECQC